MSVIMISMYIIILLLGSTIYEALVRLIATLLILKRISLLNYEKFPVVFSPKIAIQQKDAISPEEFTQALKMAVEFASGMDMKFPSLYSRLELGRNWDEVILKLGELYL